MLWPEPPEPIILQNPQRTFIKRKLIFLISKVLDVVNLEIVRKKKYSLNERSKGELHPVYADTMIGLKRLNNLQKCIEIVLKEKIEGDFIETGVWRGGACIFMRAVLAAYGIKDKKIFVADSFEGMPKPNSNKYPNDKHDRLYTRTFLSVSKEEVEENFKKYGLLDKQVVFLKGWFRDTLPNAPIKKLSILRLDGDMYGSTIESLFNLYPKLSNGGYCIIDDYDLTPCKTAVDDFRLKNNIQSKIEDIDGHGIFWKKQTNK